MAGQVRRDKPGKVKTETVVKSKREMKKELLRAYQEAKKVAK